MASRQDKTIMRSLGEFFGHIVKGVRSDPSVTKPDVEEVSRSVEEEDRDGVVLRRTTIEEIEIRDPQQEENEPN